MTELISLLFALVRSDEQLESVLEQQPLGDIRAEVAATSPECVGAAAVVRLRITPQYIHNLQVRGNLMHLKQAKCLSRPPNLLL